MAKIGYQTAAIVLFLASNLFAATIGNKEEYTVPSRAYSAGTTSSPWFAPVDVLGRVELVFDVPSRDPLLDIRICGQQSNDGGKTILSDAKGNPICSCGTHRPPGPWVLRDGTPISSFGVVCTSRDGTGKVRNWKNGTVYRLSMTSNRAIANMAVTVRFDK